MGRKPIGKHPMTAAERNKKYRENMSEQTRLSVLAKDRIAHRIRAEKLRNEPHYFKMYKRKRNQKQELRRRLKRVEEMNCSLAGSEQGSEQGSPMRKTPPKLSFFRTKALKCRSVSRTIKSLPCEKEKKLEVLKDVFVSSIEATPRKLRLISSWTNLDILSRGGRKAIINQETKEKLTQFLTRNDICYQLPGRQSLVYMGKVDGVSQYTPKKYLLWTYRELAELLQKEEDTGLNSIKFSTLYRFIRNQKEYVGVTKIPQFSCLCPTCENLELLLKGINSSVGLHLPQLRKDFLDKYACFPLTEKCALGTCDKCKDVDESVLEEIKDVDRISYYKWESGEKYQEKKLKEDSGQEIADLLNKCFKTLKTHIFNKRTQSQKYTQMIEQLEEGEVVIHIDYSENYKNKNQNEIKAAYYGQGQFTLYTCCVFIKESGGVKVKNLVLVTENNDHNSAVSFRLNEKIIDDIMEDGVELKTIHFWSDGCASQFRSQYAFSVMNYYSAELKIFWHFFESNHGKGCVDGLGGTVKHAVYKEVLTGRIVISGAKSFAEHADKLVKGIKVIYLKDMDLSFEKQSRALAQKVPGTLKVHMIERSVLDDGTITQKYFKTSVSKDPFLKKAFPLPPDVDYDEIESTTSSQGQTDDECDDEEVCEMVNYSVGSFVVVQYSQTKYPGEVIDSDDTYVSVNCMKMHGNQPTSWKWPKRPDNLKYLRADVIGPINKPEVNASVSTARCIIYTIPEMANFV